MKRIGPTFGLSALALVLTAAACNGVEQQPADEFIIVDEASDVGASEQSPSEDALDGKILEVVEVADGIKRLVTPSSVTPTVEWTTPTGSYIAIWVQEDGSSSLFEGVPADGESALKDVVADSPLELFQKLAPEGMVAPEALKLGRAYSELEAEAAAKIAQLDPEDLLIMEERENRQAPQQMFYAGTSCSKNDANDFYWNYRPGVLDNSEGVLEYSPSGYQYREARRRKDYQAFYQTNFNQWTPQQPPGGLQAAYFRASAKICTGSARLTMWRCLGNQATADNGCGEGGSTIAATFGPYSMGSGGLGTYKDWPGGDIARARLDQMSSASDHAIWSVMSSNSSYSAINNCYN